MIKTCLQCGDEYKPNRRTQKFCSKKCYTASMRGKTPAWIAKYSKPIKPKKRVVCRNCSATFETHQSRDHHKFCSRSCYEDYRRTKHGQYNGVFKDLQNPQVFYWLGFIMGDGSVQATSENNKRLNLGLKAQDRYHVEDLADFIGYGKTVVREKDGFVSMDIYSADLYDDLFRLKVEPRKTHKLDESYIPENYFFQFLRGIFDADGSIGIRRYDKLHVHFSIYGKYGFLRGLQKRINDYLAVENGGHVWKSDTARADSLTYGGRRQITQIGKAMYKDDRYHLVRKKQVWLEISNYVHVQTRNGETIKIGNRYYVQKNCKDCGEPFLVRADHAQRTDGKIREYCKPFKCGNR